MDSAWLEEVHLTVWKWADESFDRRFHNKLVWYWLNFLLLSFSHTKIPVAKTDLNAQGKLLNAIGIILFWECLWSWCAESLEVGKPLERWLWKQHWRTATSAESCSSTKSRWDWRRRQPTWVPSIPQSRKGSGKDHQRSAQIRNREEPQQRDSGDPGLNELHQGLPLSNVLQREVDEEHLLRDLLQHVPWGSSQVQFAQREPLQWAIVQHRFRVDGKTSPKDWKCRSWRVPNIARVDRWDVPLFERRETE